MKIDIRTKDCVYIEINNKTFYIDDSTGESIMDVWDNDDPIKQIDDIVNDLFPKESK